MHFKTNYRNATLFVLQTYLGINCGGLRVPVATQSGVCPTLRQSQTSLVRFISIPEGY